MFKKLVSLGSYAFGEYSCTLRLTSELVDLRVRNANPYSCRKLHEGVLASGIRGESFLLFAQHFGFNLMKCFAKSFGHRSQNNSQGCFAHCVRLPVKKLHKIIRRRTCVRPHIILVDPRGVEPLSENLLI